MAEKRDYYEVLGVPKNASDADIKKAFRTLAKKRVTLKMRTIFSGGKNFPKNKENYIYIIWENAIISSV